jgi:hypothetical protein
MDMLKNAGRHVLTVALLWAAMAGAANAQGGAPVPGVEMEVAAGPSLEIYGFIMADAIHDFQRMDPDWDDAFRPSKIPTTEGEFGGDGQSSVSVKQSRFGIKGSMPTGEGNTPLTFKFDFDLFGTGDNAGQTTFRLQNAYAEWGSLLAGQTDTLFMDIDVFPNTIDYWGPPGMVFYRNVQIRWTPYRTDNSHFAIAIERPGNDIDGGNVRLIEGFEDAEIQNDEELPDLTLQWRLNGDWGHLQAGGILRRVGFEGRVTPDEPFRDGHETGWGINLGSAISTFGDDVLRLQVVYGEGIASYMNDGGMDLAPQLVSPPPDLQLRAEAVPLTGVVAYYDHYWSDRWSSSIGYSYTEVDNTNFQDASAFHKGDYASVNLLHYPGENLMMGVELMWGEREDNNDATGDDTRIQFSVKYSFAKPL